MRKHALGILAMVSVVIVVIAAVGYGFMVSFARTSVPNIYVPSQASFGGGRIFIYIDQSDQISASRWVCSMNVGHEIVRPWDFELQPNPKKFLIRVPLWSILLPCSIAPILWLRKKRRSSTRGFPVEPATPPATIK